MTTYTGTNGDDYLFGSPVADGLLGLAGDDNLFGGDGNDTLEGSDGNDNLFGGEGNDTLDGGVGYDFATYSDAKGPITVKLALRMASGAGVGTDALISIEGVDGSQYDDTITGDSSANNLFGKGGNDILSGGAGDDKLFGEDGNDTVDGGAGNDTIDGGTGTDTSFYIGKRAEFVVKSNSAGWTVTSSSEGADTITNIERLKFADATVALDISGAGGQAYRVYQAAFNRTPDAGGVGFWIKQMDDGASLKTVAENFVNSAEFKAVYGANPTNAQIITKFYDNVLHRPGETGGYNFWLGILDRHDGTVAEVLAAFSESAENQAGLIGVIGNGFSYTPSV